MNRNAPERITPGADEAEEIPPLLLAIDDAVLGRLARWALHLRQLREEAGETKR